jgi:tetratricopeptide (TPR) repeat protein
MWLVLIALNGPQAAAQSNLPSAPQPQVPAAQSAQTAKPAPQEDNPFPESAAPSGDSATQPAGNNATSQKGKASSSDNPFPGEDSNAPIIPVDPEPGDAKPNPPNSDATSARTKSGAADPDADPVRSPDLPNNINADDGFSSSTKGVDSLPSDHDSESFKPVKNRAQMLKEDLDVGEFYAERKNWKASQERFESAFKLDDENPDAVFGLAEAEQHLNLLDKAREHYQLFLSYDPDGPHSKAAKKGLEQVEKEQARNGSGGVAPK